MDRQRKIKVCGMRDSGNIAEVASLGVDYMGFIFYPASPRYIGRDFLMPTLAKNYQAVGVFVNEPVQSVAEKASRFELDLVQLHGGESVKTCEKLKLKGIQLIKVFAIDDKFDFRNTEDFEDVADYFLFDTKGANRGGNGRTFDWRLLAKYNQRKPFFLGGGLSPGNLLEVEELKDMNIHALDFNSGLEISPGMKDVQKLKSVQQKLKGLL